MRRVIPAAFLGLEGLASAVWVAGLIQALPGHSPTAIAVVLARGLVGALQISSGGLLLMRRLPAPVLAQAAFLASALLTTLETGLRLGPSNADPTYRWLWVAVYWAYALGMIALIRLRPRTGATP
jgi:hypothetical protein